MNADSKAAILDARFDLWLTGGISIVVLVALAAVGLLSRPDFLLQDFIILTVLLNGTHFMASYRLLYSSRGFASRYPWAAYYVPGFLLAYMVISLVVTEYDPRGIVLVKALQAVSVLYLALHYTGQAWGMMSSFAFLEGIRFEPRERTVLKRTLHILVGWHLFWGIKQLWQPGAEYGDSIRLADIVFNSLGGVALAMGALCLYQVSTRIGRRIPARILTPYAALFVWYVFLYLFPKSIFWVQIFHALQYMPFPLRVELNRTGDDAATPLRSPHAYTYLLTMAATSAVVFGLLPWAADTMGTGAYNAWVALACVINIHHFYIDGCIWHISNPVVSKELFAHTR